MKSNPLQNTFLSVILVAALIAAAQAEPLIGLTSGNRLLSFDSASPGTITKTLIINGLPAGENLVGIDFRPTTKGLYGLGSTSRLYEINSDTGLATVAGPSGAFTLVGTRFGVDFNPIVDRLRVTSDLDQNLRLHPNGTFAQTDGTLQYAAADSHFGADPNVVGSAYSTNLCTAGVTILYDIDSALDILVIQNPPNDGILNTVGPLGVDTTDNVGFDISGITGILYASLTVGTTTDLYTIDQLSGAATLVGTIAEATTLGSENVIDIAAGAAPCSTFANVSNRGRVGVGEDVLITGFITHIGSASRYLLRVSGPSLSGLGIGAPLGDPLLRLHDNNGAVIAFNDDWQTSQAAEITATGLAPTHSAEPAILATLTPSSYTAIVSGKAGNTGIAVVEVYQLP